MENNALFDDFREAKSQRSKINSGRKVIALTFTIIFCLSKLLCQGMDFNPFRKNTSPESIRMLFEI